MLRGKRYHHGEKFRPLRLMDGHGVGERNLVEFAEVVFHYAVIEADCYFMLDRINLLSIIRNRIFLNSAGIQGKANYYHPCRQARISSLLPGVLLIAAKNSFMPEIILRQRRCRACGAIFCICRQCDRGQYYCSLACRQRARQQQRRAANRRYQRTARGRQTHRIRQRNYRLRRTALRVTDHGSPSIIRPSAARSLNIGHCAVCHRYSRWIDPFAGRSRLPIARVTGRSSKKYVFT